MKFFLNLFYIILFVDLFYKICIVKTMLDYKFQTASIQKINKILRSVLLFDERKERAALKKDRKLDNNSIILQTAFFLFYPTSISFFGLTKGCPFKERMKVYLLLNFIY